MKEIIKPGREPWSSVMGGNSCSEGHGFESRHHIFVVKIVMMFA